MVLPAVEHANDSLKWCFMAEHGAVNDLSKQSQLLGNPLYYWPISRAANALISIWLYRDQWVFFDYLPLRDALNGWWQVITSR